MMKLSGLTIFSLLLIAVKGFAVNHPVKPIGNKAPLVSLSPLADSVKKASDDDTADDEEDNVRTYAFGLEFGSDQTSHGLHSGKKLPYISPSFTYSAPKGFYISISDQFILSKDSGGFDAFALNPGWNIDIADNTTLNFNLTHYWFKANTPLSIKADLSDVVETYIDHWFGETEARFTIDGNYYKKSDSINASGDIILTPDIAHTFEFDISKKSSLSLIPEGSMDFGTTNEYSRYLSKSKDTAYIQSYKRARRNNKSSFAVLDLNLIFTVNYKVGNFEFQPAFNFNVPIYKVPGIPDKPLAYGTINLIYTIE